MQSTEFEKALNYLRDAIRVNASEAEIARRAKLLIKAEQST